MVIFSTRQDSRAERFETGNDDCDLGVARGRPPPIRLFTGVEMLKITFNACIPYSIVCRYYLTHHHRLPYKLSPIGGLTISPHQGNMQARGKTGIYYI